MLSIDIAVMDGNGKELKAHVQIIRNAAHHKLPHHYTYLYKAWVKPLGGGNTDIFIGDVLHNYNNGAVALGQKVLKALVLQLKEAKHAKS